MPKKKNYFTDSRCIQSFTELFWYTFLLENIAQNNINHVKPSQSAKSWLNTSTKSHIVKKRYMPVLLETLPFVVELLSLGKVV